MALPLTNLTAHFDAKDTDNLFTTANGGGSGVHTGTPSDGSLVQVWDDEEDGSNTDICFATNGNPPTYRSTTPLMAHSCLDFDGTNDTLVGFPQAASGVLDYVHVCANNAKTIFFVIYPEAVSGTDGTNFHLNDSVWCDRTETCGFYIRNDGGTYKVGFLNKDGVTSRDYIEATIALNRTWIVIGRHDGTNISLTVIDDTGSETNPSDVASGNTNSMGGELRIGGAPSGGILFNGRIGECGFYNAKLTGTDLTDLKDYLKQQWLGISVTPAAGSLTLTGLAPTLATTTGRAPGAGSLTLTGTTPTLTVGGAPTIPVATLSLTGQIPQVILGSAVILGTVTNANTAGTSLTLTFSATVASGEKLIVPIAHFSSNITVASVTFKGSPLDFVDEHTEHTLYATTTPDTGTGNVVITMTAPTWISAAAIPVRNWDGEFRSFASSTSDNHKILDDVTDVANKLEITNVSAPGDLLMSMVSETWPNGSGTSFTPGFAQTELFDQGPSAGDEIVIAVSTQAGAPSFTSSWTFSTTPVLSIMTVWSLVAVLEEEPGEEIVEGINPAPGVFPNDFPLKWVQICFDGGDYRFGEVQMNDSSNWTYGAKKPAKLIGVSPITRQLSHKGSFETTRCTITLIDTDEAIPGLHRQFRTLADQASITGAYVAVYVWSDATRRAEGIPFRIFAGYVVSHRAGGGFTYELDCEDALGYRLSDYEQTVELPPDKFTTSIFAGLDEAIDGNSIPWVLGEVSDESATTPQGVAPAHRVSGLTTPINFSTYWGGINQTVVAFVVSAGAQAGGIINGYYNAPTDPYTRLVIPGAAWGSIIWGPGQTGWSETGFGSTPFYATHGGRRYTPVFIDATSDYAQAIIDGQIIMAFNLPGVDDTAAGTGTALNTPPRIWQWILVNLVFNRYETGSYFTIPFLDDGTYSIIDTDTVTAAVSAYESRLYGGYRVGLILGADGEPESCNQVLEMLCEGSDLDTGINRHGQAICSVENVNEAPTARFTTADIEDGSFETWVDGNKLINRIEHQFGYRYVPQYAPVETPVATDPIPTEPIPPSQPWTSKMRLVQDAASQANTRKIATYALKNYVVRREEVAQSLEATWLARGLGPSGDGPRMFRFTGGWDLFGTAEEPVELGTVIAFQHPERIGEVETAVDIGRVLKITVDPLRDRVTLEGRVLRQE